MSTPNPSNSPQKQEKDDSPLFVIGMAVGLIFLGSMLLLFLRNDATEKSVPYMQRIVEVSQDKIRAHYKGDYSALDNDALRKLAFSPKNSRSNPTPGASLMVDGLVAWIDVVPVETGKSFALIFGGLSSFECEGLAMSVLQSPNTNTSTVEVDGVPVTLGKPPRCRDRRGVLRVVSN